MARMIAVVLTLSVTIAGALVAKTEDASAAQTEFQRMVAEEAQKNQLKVQQKKAELFGMVALVSNEDMRPDAVSKMLVTVENTWQAQAHAFTGCKKTGADFNCKEAPQAFHTSCAKVGKVVLSHGNLDESKEYMMEVCGSKHIGSSWHKKTCDFLTTEILNKMSVDELNNRDMADTKTKQACDTLWNHFVEEQDAANLKEEKAEEEHDASVEAAEKKAADAFAKAAASETKKMSVKLAGKKPALAIQGAPAPKSLLAHSSRAAPKEEKKIDLSKPMPLKAQEQGFSGKMVEHKDGKTVAKDWRTEYGADGDDEKTAKKSSGIQSMASVLVLLAIGACNFGQ